MTDESTLTDFLEEAGTAAESADRETGREPEEPSQRPQAGEADGRENGERTAVEPATGTYAWGKHTCSACGSSVDRVWRDGDAFVCPACKEW
ncbi:hypothetical protein ACFOZ7_16640 [Natribaculum luteum]|uniref:DUF7573 domain-containing protein n=1 Tax=Natribaculum luteum TaxID=1586232 RepID=A0ABD5P2K0_9EURY|nr:hypothetical protein [Natribaculum luteum]